MNMRRLWLKLALLLAAALVTGFALPSTLAYVTAQSATLVNTFTAPAVLPGTPAITLPPPTGDSTPLGMYILLLVLSLASMALLARRCR